MSFKRIFAQGKEEWQRRRLEKKEKRVLKNLEAELSELVQLLGQKAFLEKVVPDGYEELVKKIGLIENEQAEISQRSDQALLEKNEKEKNYQQQKEEFEKQKQELENRKRELTDRLNMENNILKTLQQALSQAEQRIKKISQERALLQKKITEPESTAGDKDECQKKLEALALEEAELLGVIKSKKEEIQTQSQRVEPLQDSLKELKQKTDLFRKEQKKMLDLAQKAVNDIKNELSGLEKKLGAARQRRNELFKELGQALASESNLSQVLENEFKAVKIKKEEVAIKKQTIARIEAQKNLETTSSYRKMLAIISAALLLFIALILLLFIL